MIDLFIKKIQYKATYVKLKHYVKKMRRTTHAFYRILLPISRYDFSIGRNWALARVSNEYNIPIIVRNKSKLFELHGFCGARNVVLVGPTESYQQPKEELSMVLIEEGFTPHGLAKYVLPYCPKAVGYLK